MKGPSVQTDSSDPWAWAGLMERGTGKGFGNGGMGWET